MKKIIILFLLLSIGLFAKDIGDFSKVNTFKATITETAKVNSKSRVTKYDVIASLPEKLKKTMISPEINKGEVYLYNGESKTIYYPLLDQVIPGKIDNDENFILKFIKDLKIQDNKSFKIVKIDNKIDKIIYNDGIIIQLIKTQNINNIEFPILVKIFDGEALMSTISLENVKINLPLKEKDFSADEITKN